MRNCTMILLNTHLTLNSWNEHQNALFYYFILETDYFLKGVQLILYAYSVQLIEILL